MGMGEQTLQEISRLWDEAAATFDAEPDHGLRDPVIRQAWTTRLANWLPPAPCAVLDMGCGTGSLSVVMASLGYQVTGADLSPAMLEQAKSKAAGAGQEITFVQSDATYPDFAPAQFDAIVCRHLLWTLRDPARILQRWAELLSPNGRLVLIEGYWHTGAGLHAEEIVAALPAYFADVSVEDLSPSVDLWGHEVMDERYVILAKLPAASA